MGRLRQQRKAPGCGGPSVPHGRAGAPSSGRKGPLKAWSQGAPSDLYLSKGDFWVWRMVGVSLAAGRREAVVGLQAASEPHSPLSLPGDLCAWFLESYMKGFVIRPRPELKCPRDLPLILDHCTLLPASRYLSPGTWPFL